MDGNDFADSIVKDLFYYAVAWDANGSRPEDWRVAVMAEDAGRRLEELSRFLTEIHDLYLQRLWSKLEARISHFASEARFRLFQDRQDAAHASLSATCDILDQTKFSLKDGKDWRGFKTEFLALLESPFVYDQQLLKCIRRHFTHA